MPKELRIDARAADDEPQARMPITGKLALVASGLTMLAFWAGVIRLLVG